ncbi:hypothetical protein Godav_029112 [Gossypium davidsonii]|uniref:Uncharacterized protein n=1 Tax=Gossypium davidsonii TaxID=34287 RepID=A0A7J8TA33_GOSDV|nr:hypothetical protein [Gossypium davidsonii]
MAQPFQMMPGAYPSPFIGPPMSRPASHKGSQEWSLGSSSFFQSHHCGGFKHFHRW